MTISRLALLPLAATIAVLTGCSGSAPAPEPTPSTAPTSQAPEPTPEPTGTDEPVAGDNEETPAPIALPTCENMLYPDALEQLQDAGWTYEASDFYLGSMIIDGGIQCMWGDFDVASDHVEIYGWAPIDEATARDAQRNLIAEGWLREDGEDGVYITENPEYALSIDDDGYGMTYLFRDGWVALSDVKATLPLITWRG